MKHAFLIMAYNNYSQLDKLIRFLDNDDIDIYLHIDKRSKPYNPPVLYYSRIIEVPRIRTNWEGASLVKCELNMLQEALETDDYLFFHLISGQDVPIKPISYILDFFNQNNRYNFIHFDQPEKSLRRYERVKYWLLFQDIKPKGHSIYSVLQNGMVSIQRLMHVDRTRKTIMEFKAGSQWWSIKNDLAKYLVDNRKMIVKLFRFTICDEMFVQTLVYNSRFYNTLYIKEDDDYHGNQRLIKWENGTPHIWTIKDYKELMNNDLLFARKFDETIDNEIICKLYEELS